MNFTKALRRVPNGCACDDTISTVSPDCFCAALPRNFVPRPGDRYLRLRRDCPRHGGGYPVGTADVVVRRDGSVVPVARWSGGWREASRAQKERGVKRKGMTDYNR